MTISDVHLCNLPSSLTFLNTELLNDSTKAAYFEILLKSDSKQALGQYQCCTWIGPQDAAKWICKTLKGTTLEDMSLPQNWEHGCRWVDIKGSVDRPLQPRRGWRSVRTIVPRKVHRSFLCKKGMANWHAYLPRSDSWPEDLLESIYEACDRRPGKMATLCQAGCWEWSTYSHLAFPLHSITNDNLGSSPFDTSSWYVPWQKRPHSTTVHQSNTLCQKIKTFWVK